MKQFEEDQKSHKTRKPRHSSNIRGVGMRTINSYVLEDDDYSYINNDASYDYIEEDNENIQLSD